AGSIANEGYDFALGGLQALFNREDIGEHLDRVSAIGKAVDERHRGSVGEFPQSVIAEGSQHDCIAVAGSNARGIASALAAGQLAFRSVQGDRAPAQLIHRCLEREAGSGGRFFEDQDQGASFQGPIHEVPLSARLELPRAIEQRPMLRLLEVRKPQKVAPFKLGVHRFAFPNSCLRSEASLRAEYRRSGAKKMVSSPASDPST